MIIMKTEYRCAEDATVTVKDRHSIVLACYFTEDATVTVKDRHSIMLACYFTEVLLLQNSYTFIR